jgi:hypothetical protein
VYPICVTCGTQFDESSSPPAECPICEDERQYVGAGGQQWTTLQELQKGHRNKVQSEEPNLTSLVTEPHFAIGERAFVIQTSDGNVLWDCISLLDDTTRDHIAGLGGLHAICISHPHYYTTAVEWSDTFGDIPVYLHADDQRWLMRPGRNIRSWTGESIAVLGGLQMVRCGGHFPGASVLHWPDGADGRGALLTGDTIQVAPDRRFVSFMWSYPNYVPLDVKTVDRIVTVVEALEFDRIYGAFPNCTIQTGGKNSICRSRDRYVFRISRAPEM